MGSRKDGGRQEGWKEEGGRKDGSRKDGGNKIIYTNLVSHSAIPPFQGIFSITQSDFSRGSDYDLCI